MGGLRANSRTSEKPLAEMFITNSIKKCPVLQYDAKSKSKSKSNLIKAYNDKVNSLDRIIENYKKATKIVGEINDDIKDSNTAQDKFRPFIKAVLDEFTKYKVQKVGLKEAIQRIKDKITEEEKNIEDKSIEKKASQLKKELSKLESQLSKIKDQSKAIKQSFSAKYGILPMHTLNNALYQKAKTKDKGAKGIVQKEIGGVIGILIRVHNLLTDNKKFNKTLVEKLLNKKFNYELKKIESVANFKSESNPNLESAENMEINIEGAYQNLSALIGSIDQKCDTSSEVLQKGKINLKDVTKTIKEFDIHSEVQGFIKGNYYKNTPETFGKSMEAFCTLAYLNEATKKLIPKVLKNIENNAT